MRALSLWQPHGSLLVTCAKPFETRHWHTSVRGEVILHAAQRKLTKDDLATLGGFEYQSGLQPLVGFDINFERPPLSVVSPQHLAFGALLGVGELTNCIATEAMTKEQRRRARGFGNFARGRFAFEFQNVRRFKTPIPFKGAQGFFNAWYDPKSVELIEVKPAPTSFWCYCPVCLNTWDYNAVDGEKCANPDCNGTMICV